MGSADLLELHASLITIEEHMTMRRIATTGLLLGLMSLMSGCIIGPHEGYYDRDHQRYYHENTWHNCAGQDEHCR